MLYCEVRKEIDGTIYASSPEVSLIILPDGKGKAFNRTFQRKRINEKKLHASLNNLAARLQQGKIEEPAAQEELTKLVDSWKVPTDERVLVGELNGVRVYIQDHNIIMTTRDLYK